MKERNPPAVIVETEFCGLPLPPLDPGGYLEEKHGNLCLRQADEIESPSSMSGLYMITRRWLVGDWDPDLYEVR